jgi:hypothetical protein
MREHIQHVFLIAASAMALGACGAGLQLSQQHQNIAQMQEEIARCRAAAAPGSFTACSTKNGPQLAKGAKEGLDEASRTENRATRVGLYAASANGGWESGMAEGFQTADTAIQAGMAECGKFAANEFAPPRDCALLKVGPGFVVHMRTMALLDRIESKPPTAVSAAEKKQLADTSTRYVKNTFDFVEAQRNQFAADPNLDSTFLTMLDGQRAVFYCTSLHLVTVNRRLGQAETARRVSRDRDHMITAVPALRAQTCSG